MPDLHPVLVLLTVQQTKKKLSQLGEGLPAQEGPLRGSAQSEPAEVLGQDPGQL